ncbi:MAG TPA: STAS domain-containing protein [Bryobacteraceae bacterium]|nr:STAS domain-containing protein [Bryobacteraceae bacterium]
MNVAVREIESIAVLDLKGRLTAGVYSETLRDTISCLSQGGKNNLILNMSQVDFVDSSGLGTLVLCFTTLQQQGGALKLANLSRRQLELMVLTKLTTVFEIFDSEQDAVNSFFPGRAIKHFDILEYVRDNNSKQ